MPDKSFKENYIFSMEKVVGSALELSTKRLFTLDKYRLKKYGLKTMFLGNIFFEVFSLLLLDQVNPFAYITHLI